jgi:transcriptional regulator with XRE-family HTH domain
MPSKPAPTPSTIGALILSARKKIKPKLTQTALAAKLGISNSHLCLIESGDRGLTVDLIPKVARILKLKPSLLVTPAQLKEARAWKALG